MTLLNIQIFQLDVEKNLKGKFTKKNPIKIQITTSRLLQIQKKLA